MQSMGKRGHTLYRNERKNTPQRRKEREEKKIGNGKVEGIEKVATIIVDTAIKVHKTLGPGLLESAYQKCHAHELRNRGLKVELEVIVPIRYDGESIDAGYRIDTLVEGIVAIENKAIECVLPLHEAQLLTYMRLKDLRLGFLLNWNVVLMKWGIKRMVNGL